MAAGATAPSWLLRFCIAGMALGAALLWRAPSKIVGFAGLALMGFAAAPIFPTLIATTPARAGETHTTNVVGFQIAAAALGLSLVPALVGLGAEKFGLEAVGPLLFMATVVLLMGYESMMAAGRRSRASA
jgi:fucose permease